MHLKDYPKNRKTVLRPLAPKLPAPAARSPEPMVETLRLQRLHQPNRKGSLILECVIASVILTSCSIALLKWKHSENQLKDQANTHTAATLLADNAELRLQQATTENAANLAEKIETELSQQQDLTVSILGSEFKSTQELETAVTGIHFTITVSKGNLPVTTKHSWKLISSNDLPLASSGAKSVSEPPSEPQEGPANE